jgi:hypothetical protein
VFATPEHTAPLTLAQQEMSYQEPRKNDPAIASDNIVPNFTPEAPLLRYEDGAGQLREIYVAPGKYKEAVKLLDAEDWEPLSHFPRWSDQPPLAPCQPNVLSYTNAQGIEKEVYLPKGKAQRASELVQEEDWDTLEKEFEPYSECRS